MAVGAHGQSLGLASHGTKRLEQLSLDRLIPSHLVATFLRDPVATNQQQDLLFVGIVVTVIAAVFALRSRMPMPMLLYGLAAASLALVAAPVGLRPRFIFLAFPLIIAVATSLRRWAYAAVLVGVDCPARCPDGVLGYFVCDFSVAERQAGERGHSHGTALPPTNGRLPLPH